MTTLLHFPTKALFFFLLSAIMTLGLCSTAGLRKKKMQNAERAEEIKLGKLVLGWGGMSEILARVLCWRGRSEMVEWRDVEAGKGKGSKDSVGLSPLWQKKILMGERCQMPMFSGVIHYDERGRMLSGKSTLAKQEKPVAPVTALKDLL